MSARERAIHRTRTTGVLPAIKLKQDEDIVPYVRAMVDGGARVVEVTMTTQAFWRCSAPSPRSLVTRSRRLPAPSSTRPPRARRSRPGSRHRLAGSRTEVIATAHRYGAACYAGAFTATECLTAVQAGADMVKIFPAAVAGPAYMTNLRMVYPEINLIPSGGISLDNAADFIKNGASAVSGA